MPAHVHNVNALKLFIQVSRLVLSLLGQSPFSSTSYCLGTIMTSARQRTACDDHSMNDVSNSNKELTDIDADQRPWYLGPYFILSAVLMVVTMAFPLVGSLVTNLEITGHQAFPQFLYFSFITLTSVGYGDVAPASPAARTVATATSIFGQLYMAILIAKLVGIYTAQSITENER